MNLQMFTKFGANRASRLVDFPDFCILWPPKTPQNAPWGIGGLIVFSLDVYSNMNPQTCNKFGANRYSRLVDFPDFFILDPLKPPKFPSWVSRS